MRSPLLAALASLFLFPIIAAGQYGMPAGAHVDLFFPQIADGGNAAQSWQTSLFFVNPNSTAASGSLTFYAPDGKPLTVTLNGIKSSSFTIAPPGNGSLTGRTSGAGPLQVGWAYATFDRPVVGNAAFRLNVSGIPQQEVSVNATLATRMATSFANGFTGIALVNGWSDVSVSCQLLILDSAGKTVATKSITVGPSQQILGTVWQLFNVKPLSFTGQLLLVAEDPGLLLLAINADSQGIISSLPSGRSAGLLGNINAVRLVFKHLVATMNDSGLTVGSPRLVIEHDNLVNAWVPNPYDGTVQVELALPELFANIDELAAVVAHELGHVYQMRTGVRFYPSSYTIEDDADFFGIVAATLAGYDPYAAAGAFGKMMMATGTAALWIQRFEDVMSPWELHQSASTRIDLLLQRVTAACSMPELSSFCSAYRNAIHPHLPGPLGNESRPASIPRPRTSAMKGEIAPSLMNVERPGAK